jgi:hypothetical protein
MLASKHIATGLIWTSLAEKIAPVGIPAATKRANSIRRKIAFV